MRPGIRRARWVVAGAVVLGAIGLMAGGGVLHPLLTLLGVVTGLVLTGWGLWGAPARQEDQAWEALASEAGDLANSTPPVPGNGGSPPTPAEDQSVTEGLSALVSGLRRVGEVVPRLVRGSGEALALRNLVEAVAEPVVATDEAGRVVIMNRAAERTLGLRLDARPRRIDDLVAQPDVLGLHRSAMEGRVASARVRLVAGDEVRVFDTTATPLGATRGDGAPAEAGEAPPPAQARRWGVVLTFRDVTDLATAVQARTDFVANASHELRTPLTALRASYDTLRMAIDDPRMRDRALQLAGSNLARLEEMTRDLLDLSRVESPDARVHLSRVDIQELAEEAAAPFEAARAARRLGLSIEIAPRARQAETDPRLVLEMLRNLIDNACRFAHEGTTIRVVGEAIDPVAGSEAGQTGGPMGGTPNGVYGEASGTATQGGRPTLRLRVIDQGIGIPIDQQPRIFERFYQVDPARSGKRRGTGLGLSIVKHAARALGGSVDVESVWGQGTTMIVELPGAVVGG